MIDLVGPDPHLVHEQIEHLVRHRLVDLEAHQLGEPVAGLEQFLDGIEEVLGLVLLDRLIGAPGDPERVAGDDLHAREQRVEVGGDHLFHRHDTCRRHRGPA